MNKTPYVHFTLKRTVLHEAPIGYFIPISTGTKFLGVIIAKSLSWKTHIDHLYLSYVQHVIELGQLNLSRVKKI
jgi:hypothetical protein